MQRSVLFLSLLLGFVVSQTTTCSSLDVNTCGTTTATTNLCSWVTGRSCDGRSYSGCVDATIGCATVITCAKYANAETAVTFFSTCLPRGYTAVDLAYCRCNNTTPSTTVVPTDPIPSGTTQGCRDCGRCNVCDTASGVCVTPRQNISIPCSGDGTCPYGYGCDSTNPCNPFCSPICPANGPVVQCLVDPCSTPFPDNCPRTARCVASYCGGCNRKFYDPNTGEEICQEQCSIAQCGPSPATPTIACPDGSTGGFTGKCTRKADGTCGWEFRDCPNPCNGTTLANTIVPCDLYCPYGYETRNFTFSASYSYSCPICRCKVPPPTCPPCIQIVCEAVNGVAAQPIIGPDGCCPICPKPCDRVICPAIRCVAGYTPTYLRGECCPTCVPDNPCIATSCPATQAVCPAGSQLVKKGCCTVCERIVNCTLVRCLNAPTVCQPGYKLVYRDGDCCPTCEVKPDCRNANAAGICAACPPGTTPVTTDLNCCPSCKPVDVCQTVLCAQPNCDRISWIKREGSCCPTCPTCRDNTTAVCNPNDDPVCRTPFFTGPNCDQPVPPTNRVIRRIRVKFCLDTTTAVCATPDVQSIRTLILLLSGVPADSVNVTNTGRVDANTCCFYFEITVAVLVGQGDATTTANTITTALANNNAFTVENDDTTPQTEIDSASFTALSCILMLLLALLF